MNFDLSFTQDSNWIANRQKAWEEIEDDVAEERTKKQLEGIKNYFFTGLIPKGVRVTPTGAVLFFPAYSKEALDFVFRERVSLKGVLNEQRLFQQIQANATINLDYWPGASREEKLNIFKMFFGDMYDPNRKFPFLIGEEVEYRNFSYNAAGLLSIVIGKFVGWCRYNEENALVWPDLVNFMLSIISHAEPWIFKKNLTEEESKTEFGGIDGGAFCRRLEELMQCIIKSPEVGGETPYFSVRQKKLQQIGDYLDRLQEPKELLEHWQWAKQEFANE